MTSATFMSFLVSLSPSVPELGLMFTIVREMDRRQTDSIHAPIII